MAKRIDIIRFTATAIALLALLVAPSAALARLHPGQLDETFGTQGRAMVPFPAETTGDTGIKYEVPFQFAAGHLQMAVAPDGKIVVAGSSRLVRLLPNGKLDRGFGRRGVVQIEQPPGQSFVLADLAVDSQDRILVAGSARLQPPGSAPDPLVSSVMVRRYAANGSLDPGFGSGGTEITAFGVEPPRINGVRYKAASIGLRGMVLDSHDRPVLTGGLVPEVAFCTFGLVQTVATGFVARLTESGAPDPSFGSGGLRQVPELGSLAQGHVLRNGNLLAVGAPKVTCGGPAGPPTLLAGFESSGNLATAFGFDGFRSVNFRSAPVANLAPSGKILLLGPVRRSQKRTHQLVMRLRTNGAVDPGFGHAGFREVTAPQSSSFDAIAADRQERVLLAGRIRHNLRKGKGPSRLAFMLARLQAKGALDRSFGHRGSVVTGFGPPANSYATQVIAAKRGRILVGGPISTPVLPTGMGFALARYVGG